MHLVQEMVLKVIEEVGEGGLPNISNFYIMKINK